MNIYGTLSLTSILLIAALATEDHTFNSEIHWKLFACPDVSGTNCICFNLLFMVEITCPKSMMIIIPEEFSRSAELTCEKQYDLDSLPNLEIGNISQLVVKTCMLNETQSILETFDSLGVTNIETLVYGDYDNRLSFPYNSKHFKGLGNLINLTLIRGFGIQQDTFEHLSNLKRLEIQFNKLELQCGMFDFLPKLEVLIIAYNKIDGFEEGLFKSNRNLQMLLLANNTILNISKEVFNGLNNLRVLDLQNNNISSLEPDLFTLLPELTELNIGGNPISRLSEGMLSGNLKLKAFGLLINKGSLDSLPENFLANLPLLKTVDLDHSKISHLPDSLFHQSTEIVKLSIANNSLRNIPEMLLSDQHQLRELNLNHNLLEKIPDELFENSRELSILRLSNNRLHSLSGKVFGNVINLKILYLENNLLQTIDHYTFSETKGLEELYLQNNQLAFHANTPFQYLRKLRTLKLQNNRISIILMNTNINTQNLQHLDLSNNQISELHYANLQFEKNSYVNLSNNNISLVFIDIEQLRIKQKTKINVDLSNNPLACNCNALVFVMYIQDIRLRAIRFNNDRLRCAEPKNLRGTFIKEVKIKDLKCMLDKCPEESTIPNCTCQEGGAELEFHCPQLNSTLDIKVQKSIQSSELTCREQYDLHSVPNFEIGNIRQLVVNFCVLNKTQSILETFDFLGVTNVSELRYDDYRDLQTFPYNSKNFEGLQNLVNLTLKRGLGIQQDTFMHLSNLKRLEIQFNKLELQRGVFDSLPNLEVLSLEYNKIDRIDEGLFKRNRNLQVLSLAHNKILNIGKEVFKGLNNLRVLDLRSNSNPSLGMYSEHLKLKVFGLRDNKNSLESLPENFFANLPQLKIVNLNDSNISHLPDSLFHQSTEIVELHLANNSLRSIPAGLLSGQYQLRDLNLDYNLLEKIPDELLENSTELTTLRLANNHLQSLSGKVFGNLINLKKLHLENNCLQTIDRYTFRGNGGLEELYLQNNQLDLYVNSIVDDHHCNSIADEDVLCKGPFNDLNNLRVLNLRKNNISSLEPSLFTSLPALTELDIGSNPIIWFSYKVFSGYLKLKVLVLSDTKNIYPIPDYFLANLPLLKTVNLEHNKISYLSHTLFYQSTGIVELSLANNALTSIPEMLVSDQHQLRHLNLDHNLLENIPDELLEYCRELTTLRLSNNHLQSLSGKVFGNLINLKKLHLENNHLHTIDHYTFSETKGLEELYLQNNQLAFHANTPFQYLRKLRTLKLQSNRISTIFMDRKINTQNLQHLDLSNNQISKLQYPNLQFQKDISVNLSNNNISMVFIDIKQLQMRENKINVDLSNNPLDCNCKIFDFVKYIQNDSHKALQFNTDHLRCAGPENLRDTSVKEVKPKDLKCMLNKNCPDECSCDLRPVDYTIVVNCSGRNLALIPDLPQPSQINGYHSIELYAEHNRLTELPTSNRSGYDQVTQLHVRNNSIRRLVSENIPTNLTLVDVSQNQLQTIDDLTVEFLNRTSIISSIRFSYNPWSCKCNASRLLNFIQRNQHRINDMSEVRCNGKDLPLGFITVNDLCNEDLNTVIVICIAIAVMGLTVGLLSTLFYRYQTEVKVWLFTHNLFLWLITEEELDRDKRYDAFISYSHMDEDFITEQLVPTLEKEPMNFKTCWHVRDFIPGEMIITQIIKSIEDSRRTVIVLSKNFLQSHWAKEEFRQAHIQSMEDNRVRVIVIIYSDIGDVEKLDPELKAYLKTNTYVKWGDPWFWDKLRYAMPHPLKIKGLEKDTLLEQWHATTPKTV